MKPQVYQKKCSICGKDLAFLSEKQLDWNYDMHIKSCKEKKKDKD